MANVSILYPAGHAFDLDYYKSKHMVHVETNWTKLGLEGWEVTTYPSDAPFQVQVILKWTSLQDFEAAMSAPVTPELFEDVKNFTTAEPVLLKGTPYSSSATK